MLVLTRKPGEKIVIGNGITVKVVEVQGNRVRIGIGAPDDVRVLRGELAFWLEESQDAELEGKPDCSEPAASDLVATERGILDGHGC
jgi:carbon storage regulator CsrA